jgi:hypothetical protein
MSIADNIREQVRANIPLRMQYLLIALGIVVVVLGLLELSDEKNRLLAQKQTLEREIQTLSEGSVSEWEDRLALASDARGAWMETRWQAETPGIASANVQKHLTELTREIGLESVRLSVASDPISTGDNDLLRFEVTGLGGANVLSELLVTLSVSPKTILITDISAPIRTDQKTRMSVAGYVPYLTSLPNEEAPQ